MTSTLIAIAGLVVLVLLVAGFIFSRYRVAKPNQALVVTGRRGDKDAKGHPTSKVVTSGGVFVMPVIQRLTEVDLSSRNVRVTVEGAPSSQGIALNVIAVATVKISDEDSSVRAAAQRFGEQQNALDSFIVDQLSGALRAIIGNMTVEDIIRNREAFSKDVLNNVEQSLVQQGLMLDNITIQEVTDHGQGSYIRDMGRPSAAAIQREAKIAEAEAERAAAEKRIAAQTEMANYQRSLVLREAEIKAETEQAQARAAATGPLEEAARQQEILAAREQVAIRQAELTEKELDTTVRRPADAQRYKAEQEAEAARIGAVKAAEAARQQAELSGQGELARRSALAEAERKEAELRGAGALAQRKAEAEALKLEGEADAAAIRARGNAEAEAIKSKGEAEAEALDARATAYERFGQAAIVDRYLGVMPEVAKELAAPMGNIEKMTVVSTDGAAALPKVVTNNFAQLQELLGGATGLDIAGAIKSMTKGSSTLEGTPSE